MPEPYSLDLNADSRLSSSAGTLDVRVRGNTLVPPSILSRFSILCAIARQLHLITQTYLSSELRTYPPMLSSSISSVPAYHS